MPQPRRRAGPRKQSSEAAFQARVRGIATYYGWRIYHAPAGGHGTGANRKVDRGQIGRGFPDLVLVKPPRLVFAELKSATGKLGPGQAEWLEDLQAVGTEVDRLTAGRRIDAAQRGQVLPAVEAYLWRPEDLETIAHVLGPYGRADDNALAFARDCS